MSTPVPAPATIPQRIWRFLGSVHLAVILLVGLAVIMAWGTIIESRFSAVEAREAVYGTWWFDTLMVLMAVNLIVAVVHRWPVPWRKWPFVVTHLGIVILLIGCWISRHYGIEGQIIFLEGESTSQMYLYGSEVRILDEDGAPRTMPVGREHTGASEVLGSIGEVEVTLEALLPEGERQETLKSDPGSAQAGYQLRLYSGQSLREVMILENHPRYGRASFGPLGLDAMDARSPEVFAALSPSEQPEATDTALVFTLPDGTQQRLTLGEVMAQEQQIGDYQVRVLETFERALVGGDGMSERESGPRNPAAVVEVKTGDQREVHVLFAQVPTFKMVREREPEDASPLPIQLAYEAGDPAPQGPHLTLVRGPEDRLYLRTAHAGSPAALQEISQGQRLPVQGMQLELELLRYLPQAVMGTEVITCEGHGRPHARVTLTGGQGSETLWLMRGERRPVQIGDRTLDVGFRRAVADLPFTATLEDFEATRYPGSNMFAQYASQVRLEVPETGESVATTISMNRPFDVAGYRLFQSSYEEGQDGKPDMSVLTASYDPGTPVVYVSITILIISIGAYVVQSWSGFARRHTEHHVEAPRPDHTNNKPARTPCETAA